MPQFKVAYHSIDLGLDQTEVEVEAETPAGAVFVVMSDLHYRPGYSGGYQRLNIEAREIPPRVSAV